MSETVTFRLAEIQARVDAATEGPWEADAYPDESYVCWGGQWSTDLGANREADANFIAHARDDIPWLLAALKESTAHA